MRPRSANLYSFDYPSERSFTHLYAASDMLMYLHRARRHTLLDAWISLL